MGATRPATDCQMGVEAHNAHMELNGECPWCGSYNPDQVEFGSIDEDGTVRAANGDIIEGGDIS